MASFAAHLFVWVGGALFVVSLAATAYSFLLRWDHPAPFASWSAVAFNSALLTVFAIHHSVFARPSVKAAVSTVIPPRLERSVYVWTASVLLLLVVAAWQPVGAAVYSADGLPEWLLWGVQLLGIVLTARSVRTIDGLELAGIRQANRAAASSGLQFGGPYRLVRHPIYLGWILIVFGTPHMTGDRLTFAVVTTVYLLLAIPWEERALEQSFGGEYLVYKQHVRWRVLPLLY